jgi:PilZ domain
MNENRRLQQRKQPERMVLCKLDGEERGSVLNLSENGLCFESLTPVEEKDLLQVRLSVDLSDAVEAKGQLAWIDSAKRTGGLRFLELSGPAREQIRVWLNEPSAAEAGAAGNGAGPAAEAGAAPDREEPRTFLRKRDQLEQGEAAPAEKPVVWQEMRAASTQLVPIERYWTERRSQFLRGVLVGFGICAAMTIPVIWYAAKPSSPAQTSASERPARDSRAEEPQAPVAQTAPPSAPAAERAEVRTVYLPSPAASPKTQRQVAQTYGASPSDGRTRRTASGTPQQARAAQPLRADVTAPLSAGLAQPLARPGSEMTAAPVAVTTDGRSSADKAPRPKKASATPQQLWLAVQAGNMKAAVALADLYARGDGVPVNCEQARVLLLVASEKRNAEAPKKLQELDKGGCAATAPEPKP